MVGVCRLTGAAPMFATVMYCTGVVCPMRSEPKLIRSGVSTTVLPGAPVPVIAAVRTPPCTFAATVRVALRGPVARGAKTTPMLQEAPGARLAGQASVTTKSCPLDVAASGFRATPPVLVRVKLSEALVVATAWLAKARVAGASEPVAVWFASAVLASSACHTPRPRVPASRYLWPPLSTAVSESMRTAGSPVPYGLQQFCRTFEHCMIEVET